VIAGVGLDVVEIARFERLLLRSPGFAARYFTAAERRACAAARRPVEVWAACFAVKEAFLKALGLGVLGSVELRDIEVTLGDRGSASVRAHAHAHAMLAGRRPIASVAWCDARAWATVVVCDD
jgi:holo-[acyl-carrier protein] synthase